MNKRIIGTIIFIVIFAISVVVYKTLQVPERVVHYHANFAVFVNDEQMDFSKDEYMHITPCGGKETQSADLDDQVHLHDNVGNVVHVHANGITWGHLFKYVRLDLKNTNASEVKDVVIKYYLNGKKTDDVSSQIIGKDDRLLISIGKELPVENVSDDAILKKQFEKVGTDAKDYDEGKKGRETCSGNGQRTFIERMKIAFGIQ